MSQQDDRKEQIQGYAHMSPQEFSNNFSGKDSDMTEEFERTKLPPKPKNGEAIICQACGLPLYPRTQRYIDDPNIQDRLIMSDNKADAKREFDFHIHHACRMEKLMLADQMTPGLLSERKPLMELLNKKVEVPKSL